MVRNLKKEEEERMMEYQAGLFKKVEKAIEEDKKEEEKRIMDGKKKEETRLLDEQALLFKNAEDSIKESKMKEAKFLDEKPTSQNKRKALHSEPETPTYYTRSIRRKVNPTQVKYRTLQDQIRSISYQSDYKLPNRPASKASEASKAPQPQEPARRPRSPLIKLRITRYGSKFEPWNPKIEDPTIIAMKERTWSEHGFDEDDETAPLLMKLDDEDELEEEIQEHKRKESKIPTKKLPKGWVWEGEEERKEVYEKNGEMVCDEDAEGEPDDMLS